MDVRVEADVKDEPQADQSLTEELRSSALLFGLVIGITAATVGITQLAFRLLG